MIRRAFLASLLFLVAACSAEPSSAQQPRQAPLPSGQQEAVFAGGCFWCMEHDMGALPGVTSVMSGYTGGRNANPTYENHTGHFEAVRVRFDPSVITYRQLVDRYWRSPTHDRQWRPVLRSWLKLSACDLRTPAQRADAEAAKLRSSPATRQRQVITPILDLGPLRSEEYHRDYARRNPAHYAAYRTSAAATLTGSVAALASRSTPALARTSRSAPFPELTSSVFDSALALRLSARAFAAAI
jgi:peptide-methionine (S)-S-oxide reductase